MAGGKLFSGVLPDPPAVPAAWASSDSLGVKIEKMFTRFMHKFVLPWPAYFAEFFVQVADSCFKMLRPGMLRMFDPVLAYYQEQKGMPEHMKAMIARVRSETGEAAVIGLAAIVGVVAWGAINTALQPVNAVVRQYADLVVRSYLPGPDVFIQMYNTGAINRDEVGSALGLNGVGDIYHDKLIKMAVNYPAIGEAIEFFRRGLYTEAEFTACLRSQAVSQVDAAKYIQLAYHVPPVNDLISMMVREAFSDDVSNKFGYDNDYPSAIDQYLPQVGLRADWGKRYWRSHWALPSPTQGYEMLHRGIITQSELDMLLKTADYPTFWREKLMRMSYNVFTRVDIRRMYQSGQMTEAEVFAAYKENGYDDVKARKMTDFVLSMASTEERDLTRADLADLYEGGMLDRSAYLTAIGKLGYDAKEADYLVLLSDYNIAKAHRAEEVAIVRELFAAGSLSEAAARTKLATAGLRSGSIDRYLLQWKRENEKAETLPTLTEAKRLYLGGYIERQDVVTLYQTKHYAQKWIGAFMRELDDKKKQSEE